MVKVKAEDVPKKDEEEESKCNKAEEKPEEEEEKKAVEEDEEDVEKEEEEDDEEAKKKKKKKAVKGEQGGENPSESVTTATAGTNTITPRPVIGVGQHVLVPQSSVAGSRNATGNTPSDTHYSGKSAEPDMLKSPLFIELSKQIDGLSKAVKQKIEAVEKSVQDRMANVQKSVEKIEKFYKQPFYKAIDENMAPESVVHKSISDQIKDGRLKIGN